MAVDLGDENASRYYTIPHADVLDLPSAGWCVGIRCRVENNTGALFQYLVATVNVSGDNGGLSLFLREASEPGTPNSWGYSVRDNAGVGTGAMVGSATPGADGLNRLVILQYTGAAVQAYHCLPGAAAVQDVTSTVSLGSIVVANNWHIGIRPDVNVSRFWEEHFGELFKGDRSLSTDEIAAIARGVTPLEVLRANLKGWWNFFEPTATVKDLVGANDATQVGTSYPAASEHFPLQTARTFVIFGVGAPFYTQTKFQVFNDDGIGLGPPP